MTKTQVQLPDELYREAKRVAKEREISLAEVMRRGLEYIVKAYPPLDRSKKRAKKWKLPGPLNRGLKADPFADPEWRERLWSGGAVEKMKVRK
jgi:hypothetical protein